MIQGDISIGSHDLWGQGVDQTLLQFRNSAHFFLSNNSTVEISDFSFNGQGYATYIWYGVITVRGANKTLTNLKGTADNSIQTVFEVIADDTIGNPISNITFSNCHADNPNTFGFLHNQWFDETDPIDQNAYTTHTNILYENCTAVGCGSATGFPAGGSSWVTGFCLSEYNHVSNLTVKNCRAEKCWESGFHFEWNVLKNNVLFEDCQALNNGQKPYVASPVFATNYFGVGFLTYGTIDSSVTLRRCYAEGNSWFGFYGARGTTWEDCVDYHTGKTLLKDGSTRTITSDQRTTYRPASFRAYPSRYSSLTNTIVIDTCHSFASEGYGCHFDQLDKADFDDLYIIDPVGVNNLGCCFGCVAGQFDRVDIDGLKVYSNLSYPVYCYNNDDAVFTGGYIVSTDAGPFYIDGSGTGADYGNIVVQNMTMYHDGTMEGTTGVVVDGTVPGGKYTITSISQQAYSNAPTKPTVFIPSTSGPVLDASQSGEYIVLTWSDPS